MASTSGENKPEPNSPSVGDRVVITDGVFAAVPGLVTGVDTEAGRATVDVSLFGQVFSINCLWQHLRPVRDQS